LVGLGWVFIVPDKDQHVSGEAVMTGYIGDRSDLTGKVARLEEELRSLALRLDRSERGLRRMRRVGAGSFAAVVLMLVGGAAQLGTRTPRLDVVGPNDDVRVSISVNQASGSAGLEVFGLNGRRVLFLGTSAEGVPNMALYDAAGQGIVRTFTP
jgi:hypothetical protein